MEKDNKVCKYPNDCGTSYNNLLQDYYCSECRKVGLSMDLKKSHDPEVERIFEDHIGINSELGYRPILKEDVLDAIAEALETDLYKNVYEHSPPTGVDLLVKSPKGNFHIARWRSGSKIFTCQEKGEDSSEWQWKTLK